MTTPTCPTTTTPAPRTAARGEQPEHTNLSDGTACGANLTCVNGACTGCAAPSDCPGNDDECKTRTCNAGQCGFSFTASGTALDAQVEGDCKEAVCDGAGNTQSVNDDSDLPANDGSQCTNEICTAGVPSHPNKAKGTACDHNGGLLCNGAGACVAPSCDDELHNGDETDVDCGGSCGVCPNGGGCAENADCASAKCTGNICQAPTCNDGVKNGNETGVDCGGSCSPCPGSLTTVPTDGATKVSISTTIAITFSAAMNTATLTAQTATGVCSGSIQVSTNDFTTCIGITSPLAFSGGDTVVTLTPAAALSHEATYKIRVTSAAKDAQDTAITQYTSATGFTTASAPAPVQCTGSQVVISQVYGGGGNSGAPYKNDFVELHNRGTTAVNLTGWSVVYASAAGSSWTDNTPASPDRSRRAATTWSRARAAATSERRYQRPMRTGTINMSATAGKVALVNGAAGSNTCPAQRGRSRGLRNNRELQAREERRRSRAQQHDRDDPQG